MEKLQGFDLKEKIFEGARAVVWRGTGKTDGKPVTIKFLRAGASESESVRFENEFKTGKLVQSPHVMRYYSLEEIGSQKAIVMEDIHGESLKKALSKGKPGIGQFLKYAIAITEALEAVHHCDVIHKDVKPHNILLNEKTGELKLIDFSISTQVRRETAGVINPERLEGTLAYIAPEQTGRMNRSVDFRADFYSLGVTFYEMLCGKPPFESGDAMELVHMHMAVMPKYPSERNPEVPEAVSDIVMKLLAKNAEERYQSACGLLEDLKRCQSELETKGHIDRFATGQKDVSDRFAIPEKMYGREKEREVLFREFDKTVGGEVRSVFVNGHSGIGKSFLINEIHKPLVSKKGYFISGKFDQFKKNIPYSAVIQAFGSLVRQILAESDEKVVWWKEEILKAVGQNGQVVVDIIPELELVIGKQAALPFLEAAETQNRFNFTFQNFIKVFARKEHPLVVFLDDLQWADGASLKWLEMTLKDREMGYFLFIGSYRDNEVDAAHPLTNVFEGMKKEKINWTDVKLAQLAGGDIARLVADTLSAEQEKVSGLAEIVGVRTGGNPLFVTEYLKSLYADRYINFENGWKWDIEKIRLTKVTDNVVEFMAAKIRKLPEETQKIMKIASCIGVHFYTDTLAKIYGKSEEEVFNGLKTAMNEGLVIKLENRMMFAHDRIQESVYSLIQEEDKTKLHYEIGKDLLANTPEGKVEERVFAIVHQLNLALPLITDEEEKRRLLELNLKAGQKAKASTAYQEADNFLNTAIRLLPTDAWEKYYDLTLQLHTEIGEVLYLIGRYEEAEKYFDMVIRNGKNIIDKVRIYELRIVLYTTQVKYAEGFEVAREAMKLLKITMPRNANTLHVLKELIAVQINMKGRNLEDQVRMPPMKDPTKLIAMRVIMNFGTLAYFGFSDHVPVMMLKILNYSLKYGNSILSCFSYVVYGYIMCAVLNNIELGYRCGLVALDLMDQFNAKAIKSKVSFLAANMVFHWKIHYRDLLPFFKDAIQSGLESGDHQYATYSINHYIDHSLFMGKNLNQVYELQTHYSETVKKLKQEDMIVVYNMTRQIVFNMCKDSIDRSTICGEFFDEKHYLPIWIRENNQLAIAEFVSMSSILWYVYGDYKRCIHESEFAKKYLNGIMGMSHNVIYYFYYTLSLLVCYDLSPKKLRKRYSDTIKSNYKKMKFWKRFGPANIEHKCFLIEAETRRIRSKRQPVAEILKLYDDSIELAHKNEFIHEEAIASERAGRFCLERNMKEKAEEYLLKAYECYNAWGAAAKVKDLAEEFPVLRARSATANQNAYRVQENEGFTSTITENDTTGIGTSGSTTTQILDLSTVMKASQTISGEIVMAKLLEKLSGILMENAGAEKTALVLDRGGKLVVETVFTAGEKAETIGQPLGEFKDLPETVTRYVARTRENVVLENASGKGEFTKDPYILENRTKSVLCTPIMNQGKFLGLIYLENNLAAGAFTKERLQVLSMLSGQIGISLDNAKLYGQLEDYSKNLEKKVEERTKDLNEANRELTKKQKQIAQEMDIARMVQMSLVPDREHLPKIKGLDIAAMYIPMEDIGGDIYDVIKIDDTHYALLIADVSGHGVPAALITTMMKASFNYHSRPGIPAEKIMAEINEEMVGMIGELEHYFTAYFGILDISSGKFCYANGGHHPAILYRKKEGKLYRLEAKGTLMGSFPGIEFNHGEVTLEPGDGLLLYTDGIVEARNGAGDMYEEERLYRCILKNPQVSAGEFVSALSADLNAFCGKKPANDDRTMLFIKYR